MRKLALLSMLIVVGLQSSSAQDATLLVSAVVLPKARCAFSLADGVSAAELDLLSERAAQPAIAMQRMGRLHCVGHRQSTNNAHTNTRFTLGKSSVQRSSMLQGDSGWMLTIEP